MVIKVDYSEDGQECLVIEGFGPNTIIGALTDVIHEDGTLRDGEKEIFRVIITNEDAESLMK